MEIREFSKPIDLKKVSVSDRFWDKEQELVRREVIPYQWEALNDRVAGADPSFCMRNFRTAGKMLRERKEKRQRGEAAPEPVYSFRGFNALPEDPDHLEEDTFYGFVFQDTDFYKWIESVGYSLIRCPDPELEKLADQAIDVVCAAQLENGYLDTYYIINGMDRAFTNLQDHHELYCLGHLLEGAIAYYEATGKDKLLKAACRFADYVDDYFGEQGCQGYPGHEIAEMALARLAELTGEIRYLKLAERFLLRRGTQPWYFDLEQEKRAKADGITWKRSNDPRRFAYYQAHENVLQQSEAVGHAVRAMYLYSGMADVARMTQNEEMYAACQRLWKSVIKEKLYITGGIGGTVHGESFSYRYDLPNDAAYSETCAAIGLAFFARRMLQIHADSSYGDVMEQALFNTVLSGMSLDGKSFFYVNPLEVIPDACKNDIRLQHVKSTRQKWFGCACCPPNLARIISSIPSYAYTGNEEALYVHLYMSGQIEHHFQNGALRLHVKSHMPWSGENSFRIENDKKTEATLAFRIPGWTQKEGIKILLTGKEYSADLPSNGAFHVKIKDGYLYLTGSWEKGQELHLNFPMPVHMKKAHLLVRENRRKLAFTRGPITYCMEEADNGENLHLWQVDLDGIGKDLSGIRMEEAEIAGERVVVLKVPALREREEVNTALYEDYDFPSLQKGELLLVPYYVWNNRGEGEMRVWISL